MLFRSKEEYKERMEEVLRFLKGDHSRVLKRLEELMQQAAERKQFERAAKLRDTSKFIQSLSEQQVVSGTSGENTDIVGVALQADRAQIVLLQEREGKIVNELHFAVKGYADSPEEILEQFLPQYYEESPSLPDTVILPAELAEQEVLAKWLTEKREKNVELHVPERGKKRKLLKMAEENAREKVQKQLATWEAAAHKVKTALKELKEALQLKEEPKRIECYDKIGRAHV